MNKRTEELMRMLSTEKNIEKYLTKNQKELINMTVGEFLTQLLQEYHVQKAEVIKRSGLNQIYAYQIFANTKTPSRDKLIALIYGFPLQVKDAARLLKVAKVSELYARNKRDSVIIFGLVNGLTVHELDDLLDELHEETVL